LSSSDDVIVTEIDTSVSDAMKAVAEKLRAAMVNPDTVSDLALQDMMAVVIRFYAKKAEMGMASPFPPRGGGDLTATDVMLATTDMLHALNVQMFELSMWQAMTGNCIAPQHRVQAAE
jgi:hypothetical protein